MVDVYNRLRMSESGGNRFATNPRSSALGPDQFLDGTWLTTIKKHRPDLAAGKTDAQLLALRTDETLSGEMSRAYGGENLAYLRSRGIQPGPGAIKLSHFAGPVGAAAIYSNPAAPVERLLGRKVIEANPFLAGWSGKKAIDWAAQIEGGGKGTMATTNAAPSAAPVAAPVAGTTGSLLPDIGTLPPERRRKLAELLYSQAFQTANSATNPLGALSAIVQAGAGRYAGDRYDEEKSSHAKRLAEAMAGAKTGDDLQRVMLASGDDDMVRSVANERLAAAKPKGPIEVAGNLVQQQPDGTFKRVYEGPGSESVIEIFDEQGRPQKALVNSRNPGQYKLLGGPKAAKSEITAADRKEIFEADEGAQASSNVQGALKEAIELNKKAYTGLLPQTRGWVGSQFGMENAEATQNLQNLVLTQVLDSLKATFGAAPTEGERQILVEVQGSVDKAPNVRNEIFKRASAAAAKRQQFNMQKAKGLRSGTYYSPDFNPLIDDLAAPPPGGDVPPPGAAPPPSGGPARAGANTPPPAQSRRPSENAVNALLADTSPEAMAEFDEWFNGGKPGLAQRIIDSRKTAPASPQEVQQQPGYGGGLY